MASNILKDLEKRPAAVLIVGAGLVAGLVAARTLSDDSRRRQVKKLAQRGFDTAIEFGQDWSERALQQAREAGNAGEQLAGDARQAGERLAGTARDTGEQWTDEARRASQHLAERAQTAGRQAGHGAANAIDELPRPSVPQWATPSKPPIHRRLGIEEKTLAVFMATILSKGFTGFMKWRSEQKARAQGEALAHESGKDFETRLEEKTVVELRKEAADRDIEGRSSMNKDELVEALKE